MRISVLAGGMLLCALAARADKIVLKNGRQIVAYNVSEVGDKVQYETSAGQLTIPKKLVDHIERGGLMRLNESPAVAAAHLNVAPPPVEAIANLGEIDHAAVHDGVVEREYISRLETDARAGGAQSKLKAALALHAASQFELARGDVDHALADERAAVTYQPEQPALLMNLAYLYLRKSEFKNAIESLNRAERVAPGDADVYKLEGWAYYGMNRLGPATEEWKKSLEIRPDADTQTALEKALRDKAEEESYKENESAHFQLKYNGAAEPTLAREVLRTLEGHFNELESELNYTPPEPIGVVLYTQEGYSDITQAPRWVGAINDGRIRVPVQGLSSVTWDLSRVLKHELTHSFIQQKTRGRAPTWLQEGVAQWLEGKRSDESANVLVQVYNDGQAAGLGQLEGSWLKLQDDIARYAYAWALANTEYVVETQGMSDVERILDRIAAGASTEQAIRDVLHDDYGDLMSATVGYLKKNYVR